MLKRYPFGKVLYLTLCSYCRLSKLLNEIANEPETKTMIFVETKRKVDEIARAVTRYGYHALAIHGDKSQTDRDYVLNQFRVGRVNILVATDVAARGLGMLHLFFSTLHNCNIDINRFYNNRQRNS